METVAAILERARLDCTVDAPEHGAKTVVVVFEDIAAWIHISDDLPRTVATWRGTSTSAAEDHITMHTFAHGFNTLHCLPKVYVEEEGNVEAPYMVTTEHSALRIQGMTDKQLDRPIVISFSAWSKVMDAVAQELAHCLTWTEEEE